MHLLKVLPLTLCVYVGDFVTKALVRAYMTEGESIPLIKNIFSFTFIYNKNAVFGLPVGNQTVFTIFTILAVIFIVIYFDGAIYLKGYLQPIYEEKVWQIHSISVADSSGKIIWSTKSAEIKMPFRRPNGVTYSKEGIFIYSIDGTEIYEFEKLTAKKHDFFSGKIRVMFLEDYLERQIKIERIHHLRNGLIVLGVGYIAILFLAHLTKYPPPSFFKHPKKRHGAETDEIADEFDTFVKRVNENPEWGILNEKISRINPPKQIEAKETGTKTDDKAPDKNEGSGLDAVNPAKITAKKPEYNFRQLPEPSPPAETQKSRQST